MRHESGRLLLHWRQPVVIAELVDLSPAFMRPYQPRMRYLLIDEGALVAAGGLPDDNPASLLFQLEHNQGLEHTSQLLHTLARLVQAQHEDLYRLLGQWVRYILLPRALPDDVPLPDTDDLTEISHMTATVAHHSRDWTLKYRQEGHAQGLDEGRQEGRQQAAAAMLRDQLTRKFGLVPEDVLLRLSQAGEAALRAWSLNLLDAERLEDVFR